MQPRNTGSSACDWEKYDPSVDHELAVSLSCDYCPWSTTVRNSEVDGSSCSEAGWQAARHEEMHGKHRVGEGITVHYKEVGGGDDE